MLRTTAIGLVSAIALGVSLASAAGAMGGHGGGGRGGGGGGAMGAHDGGGGAGRGGGGGGMQGGGMGGGNAGRASPMSTRSESSPGRYADHDMGRMRVGEDHDRDHGRDHDRDRHDHDRFRFFPSFAFGFDTYSDGYVPGYGDDCWELHRVLIRGHWRLHRIWVCD